MPFPDDFERESLYTPDQWYVHDVLEIDPEAGRVVGVVDTTRLGPVREAQKPWAGHTPHVPGAVIVQATGTLGNLHAVYVLGLRMSDGWVGYGTHIHSARFLGMGAIGPALKVSLQATRVRRISGAHFVTYDFRFEQEGRKIYESSQTAVWTRGGAGPVATL